MTRPTPENGVYVDFETATTSDYSLGSMSSRAYIEDPRFDALSVSVAVGAGPIRFFHKLGAPGAAVADGVDVIRAALGGGAWLVCHNTGFDALILKLRYGIEARHVFDTIGYAAYLRLGTSLSNVARHMGLRKLEAPNFDEGSLRDPTLLAKFARYNAADVMLVRKIFTAACTDATFPAAEFEVLDLTQRNNITGLRLDTSRIGIVGRQLADARDQLLGEIATRWTVDTTKLGSPKAMSSFIETTFGYKPACLRKDDPELLGAAAENPALAEFLRKRNEVRTLGKYAAQLAGYARVGGRVFSPLRYNGAHTGRFSGSGKDCDRINIHNLPKAKRAPHPAIGSIRTLIVPEEGKNFVAADLSTIEARVIAALAGEEEMLRIFRERRDLYVWFSSRVFPGINIVKNGENDDKRQLGKQAVLGLGFGMGFKTFRQRVRLADPTSTDEDIRKVFDTYQNSFPGIASLRRNFWSAFRRAADYGESLLLGRCVFSRTTGTEGGPTVEIALPTGRRLFYRAIQTLDAVRPWGPGLDYVFDPDFEYEATSRRHGGAAKVIKMADGRLREFVTPQKVVENAVQAIARDIMVHQMLDLARGSLRPVFHVHDELVCECAACDCAAHDHAAPGRTCSWFTAGRELVAGMSRVPATLPELTDIPVEAELNPAVWRTYAG